MTIHELLNLKQMDPEIGSTQRQKATELLLPFVPEYSIYPDSLAVFSKIIFMLVKEKEDATKKIALVFLRDSELSEEFDGITQINEYEQKMLFIKFCALSHENALALRKHFPFTAPKLVGIRRSIGCGDRIGLATPGHIRAVRGTGVSAILAQQSIREMTRTQRTPEEVMDDVSWAVFQEGFQDGFGSDADHLKTTEDIDITLAAGFTMFTIDPGDHVDDQSENDSDAVLLKKYKALDWATLECSDEDCLKNYTEKTFAISDDYELQIRKNELIKAAVKYGNAILHTVKLYRHLLQQAGKRPFELEVSVDETATPTTLAEHFYIASELKRLGVKWVSLAPRFIGDFEKGIDYKGDLDKFERIFMRHVQISQHLGPYKISLHSGSDKFSIYPIAAKHAGELVHLKTAGTSYLEALHTVAEIDPDFFEEIYIFALEHFETDRASYHISTKLSMIPSFEEFAAKNLPDILDDIHCRQLLHVTFGSVLTMESDYRFNAFRGRLLRLLKENEEMHYGFLTKHLGRHVAPFAS